MQYAGKPQHNRYYYQGSCPICREGTNWLRKKRLFYFPNDEYLYCHNCFASDQSILTLEYGIVPFSEIKGKTVTVKSKDGIWRKTVVQSYGIQPVYEIVFKGYRVNSKMLYKVKATKNHKWFIKKRRRDKQNINYKETTQLAVGDNLYSIPTIEKENIDGIIHGIIFGDGTYRKYKGVKKYAIIRVCKQDKSKEDILNYFRIKNYNITYPPNLKGDAYVNLGAIPGLKDLPTTNDPAYISGFIKGWWLADGDKGNTHILSISSIREDAMQWVKQYAPLAGYRFSGYSCSTKRKCYTNAKPLFKFSLSPNSDVKVKNISFIGNEEVFCVEEPITGGFYLGNGLMTGNCSRSWTPYFWIKEITGLSFKEILADIKDYMGDNLDYNLISFDKKDESIFDVPDLPGECVNLTDAVQMQYYKNNNIVKLALQYCNKRRLFTAINKPKTLYVCLNDTYHKNRLIIPYYKGNKIECYISRKLLDKDQKAKYLVKFNSPKPLFNFEKIDPLYPYIFIIEGPIDSMFLKNSTSITGIHLTQEQDSLLSSSFPLHERIWIYDNPKFEDKIVVNKIKDKMKSGEKVFLYEGDLNDFKDLNEYCTQKSLDFVDPDLIVKGSYSGSIGLLKL